MSDKERISIEDATRLVERAFLSAGVHEASARSVARALVAAEAEGQVGHGFSRVTDYVAQARSGKVRTDSEVTVERQGSALAIVDAGHGFAFPALDRATDLAAEIAMEHGAAVVGIRRSHHAGVLAIQVERIAAHGCLALMVANTPSAIAPWGGKTPIFGTNPIAFAVPRADGSPLVADLSLSRVARGKVMNAKKTGQPIPEGWALDKDGQPTTDAAAALQGSMLPIGEAKGTVLALFVEVLSALLPDANLSSEASSFFEAEGEPPGTGQTIIAIRPPNIEHFAARMETLLALIVSEEGTRLPGERRLRARAQAERDGLHVASVHLDAVRKIAAGKR